ncbi:FG-GAP-like repeat-containing protein [Argonema galeatum]|uniref:FG-GAP-like repeat-containing protein n=1 Tax=Argonema galeatum TaxID=2942762 RepID=UPI0020115FD8|nr:FG-GAP-like repeat-containing protein [Argonema galeatum]MCL1467435.1 FG-GAP-like repeat-containing protein [Argonema galeatum A003/A1]
MFSDDNPLAINQNSYLINMQGNFQSFNQTAAIKNIAFIDRTVENYQNLVAGIVPNTEIVLLDPTRDGIEQITQILASRTEISSAHIISHGDEGSLQLGTAHLDLDNLNQYRTSLEQWKNALTPDADILLYGCNVAAGEKGTSFIQNLSQITDADIAASDNLTGSKALGGDWNLEAKTGTIEAPLAFRSETMAGYNSILFGFAPATNYPAVISLRSVVTADLNGDSKLDLVAASTFNTLSVLLGTGTGTFGTTNNLTVDPETLTVTVADFNGDGKSDIASASLQTNKISIMLGDGTGTFGAITNFNTGNRPSSIAVGDFNADGKADLVTSNNTSNDVSILLGKGDGSFNAATSFSTGLTSFSVAVADFNGDGKSDLATANYGSNDISILLGKGDGSFNPATNLSLVTTPRVITVGDFNSDGKLDLATANLNDNNVAVLLGDGAGNFGSPSYFGVATQPLYIANGDLDGDGKLDLVTANNQSGNVSVILGDGKGSFGAASNYSVGTEPQGVTVGDFNRDGLLDIAAANFSSRDVSVLLNNSPVVNFGAATYSGTEGSSDAVVNIPITLSATPTADVTVPITINATSTAIEGAGNDYTLSTNSVVFVAGATGNDLTKNIAVTIKPDNIPETDETVVLSLGNITGAAVGTTKQTTLTIAANDGINYGISAGVVSISEGNSGSNPLTFTVSRGGGIDAASSVDFAIAGTATNNSDYNNIGGTSGATSTTGTINFAPGEIQKTITMNVVGDTAFEPDETVIVNLSNPVAPGLTPTISNSSATTTINNDDTAPQPGTLQFTAANFSVPEGNSGTFVNSTVVTVNRTGGSSGAVSVQVRVNPNNAGTADANDYNNNAFPITVNFADGDTAAKTVVIPINGDTTVEPDETVNLELISGSVTGGATIGSQNTAILTISNDDATTPFTDINAGLTGVYGSSVAWGDYDNDGKLDILLTGYTNSGYIAKVYRNTGSGFTDINAGLTGVYGSSVAWGDYDNDGKLDILLTGETNSGFIAKVYRNTGSGFTDINAGLPSVIRGSAAWGDYDNDGKLDILLTGGDSAYDFIAKIYRNNALTANTPPTTPTGLSSTISGTAVTLNWNPATDAQTPTTGLGYNLRVGTTPGGNDVFAPMSLNTGYRQVPQLGNTNLKTSWQLNNLTPGQSYYWSVQAIDTAWAGSPFATAGSFTVANSTPSTVSITTNSYTDANAAEVVNGQPDSGLFTLTRTGNLSTPVTVNYTTGGTATNSTDYNNLPGSITFGANQSTATLPINIINDNLVEGSETATVTITPNNAYNIGSTNNATVFIADTINVPQTINSNLINTDPNNPTRTGSFRDDYRLNGVTVGQQVQLNLNAPFDAYLQLVNEDTGDVIAFNDDYNGLNSQLTFTVQPNVNYLARVTSYRSGATGNYSLITSIPTPPTVNISATDANAAEVVSGQTPNPGQFTVSRTGSTANSLTVNYTRGGTATNGQDYNSLASSFTIPAGASSANLPINVIDDNQAEGDEVVSLTLIGNSTYNLGNANSATVTIADNEPAIAIPTINGSQTLNATLSSADPNNPTRSGRYKDDYRLVGVTPGQTIQINLNAPSFDTYLQVINADTGQEITSDDDSGEGRNSQLSLTVQPGINYLVRVTSFNGGDTGNYTLITAAPPSVVTISATDANAAEVVNGQTPNPGQFTITRTGNTANSLTVNYTTGGTATKGTDYNNLPGNIVIPAGQTSINLPINVIDDSLREGSETAILTLAANSAYTIGNANSGTVTIADNEPFNSPPQEIIHLHNSFRYPTNGAVTISNVYTDPDGDRLTYTATQNNGEPLPSWLQFSFNSNTNNITFNQVSTPPNNWQYSYVKLTATDPWGASANQIFRIDKSGSGWVIDGYIAGSTIFFDANKNGVIDRDEPSTKTDSSGAYQLDISPNFDTNNNGQFDPEEGNFVANGGTDTATGLPLETPLTAPPYASVVTLLTSMVTELLDRGMNPDEAESQVKAALSLPSDVNLTSLDPIAATNNKEPGGVEVLAAMVKVQNFITETKAIIDGAFGQPQGVAAAKNDTVQGVVSAIVNQIESGVILDFSNPEQLAVIIEASVNKAKQLSSTFNPVVNSEFIASSANVMAQVNQRIDKIVATTAPDSIQQQIARVQKVALGEITLDFKAAASGTKSINELIAENTGSALNTKIQTARIPGVPAVPIINHLPKFDSTHLFDSDFYLQQNPDVADAIANKLFADALAHFSQFGYAEGRNPSAIFATDYLNKNSDVAAVVAKGAFHSGFEHFMKYGMAEGRSPAPEFMPLDEFYISANQDVAQAVSQGSFKSGIEHLMRFGMAENRDPFTRFNIVSETFDPTFYLAWNQDVAEAVNRGVFHNAFEQFVNFGIFEGRNPSILFDNSLYLNQNRDVAAAVSKGVFHSGMEHFLKFGIAEGRGVTSTLS